MGARSHGRFNEVVGNLNHRQDDAPRKVDDEEEESATTTTTTAAAAVQGTEQLEESAPRRHRLARTMLDTHRREMLSACPTVAGLPSMETVDEYISILRHEELVLKVTPDFEHPALSVIFPLSMGDPELFKCFIVGAQSLYEWRRNPAHVHRSRAILHLKRDAITSVQNRLSSPGAHLDDGLVISVAHLMIADACLRDLPSLKSHLRGVRQILSLRGGLGDSPAHLAIRALITTVEFYIALGQYLEVSADDTTTIPTIPIEHIPHPFPPEICRLLSTLPPGLAEAALSGQFSVQCIKLLASVASWAHLVDGSGPGSSDSDIGSDSEQVVVVDSKTRFCRLFCEPRECCRSAMVILLCLKRLHIPSAELEIVICLGLAIAIRHLSGENRTNFFDTASLATLTTNVKAIDNPSVGDSEVLTWLALLVSWRTQQSTGPLPEGETLLDYILESFPAARSWKTVSAICRKFWWFERFKSEWEKCWARASARLQRRSLDKGQRQSRSILEVRTV